MAKLLALRRASSLLSRLAADSATGFAFIIEVVLPKYLWLLPKRHQRANRYLFTSSSRLVGAIWYRVWQVLFGPRRPADPRVSEIRSPPKSDFHTVVKKNGLSITLWESNTVGAILKSTTLMKLKRWCGKLRQNIHQFTSVIIFDRAARDRRSFRSSGNTPAACRYSPRFWLHPVVRDAWLKGTRNPSLLLWVECVS